MLRDDVLALLKRSDTPLSGEAMSQSLGVSRAAVWKAMEALRQEGYIISSAPNRGYLLKSAPDCLSAGELSGALAGLTIGTPLVCLPTIDSTNSEVKRRAMAGAPEGLAILADEQTGGRGRRGRDFSSPPGKGLYASVLLRPDCAVSELASLTAWTAVAVCDAIEAACGIRPGIKWTNDIVLNGRKLCGILTELGIEGETGQVQYVVLGAGINVSQDASDFGPDLAPIAISLQQAIGHVPRRAELAASLLTALDRMYAAFPGNRIQYLERYRADCLTTGKEIQLLRPNSVEPAFAEAIDDQFALVVRHPDGRRETVNAGEVSVRGLCGYAE